MAMNRIMISAFLLILCFQDLSGQSTSISGSFGIAQYANTDELISKSRYSGTASIFSTQVRRINENSVFKFQIQLLQGDKISDKNLENLSAEVLDFALDVDHLFSLPSISVGPRNINIWIGPGYKLAVYERKQNIALGGSLESKLSSYFMQIPIEFNTRISLPINSKLEVVGDFSFNIISMGIRSDLDDNFDAKALLFVQNLNSSFDLRFIYKPVEPIGFFASWNNQYTRVTGLDQNLTAGYSGVNLGLVLNLSKKH